MSSLCAMYLYAGEKDHLQISLFETLKVCDEVFIFGEKSDLNGIASLENYNVHLIALEWNQDFSKVRNEALDVICNWGCESDWILAIDADECLDPKTSWQIQPYIDMYGNQGHKDAFSLKIVNNSKYWLSEEQYIDSDLSRKLNKSDVRIFRKTQSLRYRGRINESINLHFALVQEIDVRIFHHAYRQNNNDLKFLIERQEKFSKWYAVTEEERESFKKNETDYKNNVREQKLKLKSLSNKRPLLGFFALHFDPPLGGAEKSMMDYFKELSSTFDIEIFCFLDDRGKRFNQREKITINAGLWVTRCDTQLLSEVNHFLQNRSPDIIGTQLLGSDIVVAAAKAKDIPCIFFAHGLFEDVCQHYLRRTCNHDNLEICPFSETCPNARTNSNNTMKYGSCDLMIYNSDYTKKIFQRFYPSITGKQMVLNPYVDKSVFKKDTKRKNGHKNTVLAVNSMQLKGRDIIAKLAMANPQIRFIYTDVKDQDVPFIYGIQNLEIRKKLSKQEMSELYRSVDLTIVPTLMRETFGLVVKESLMCGTPVLCSKRGNLPNLITDGENGYIVENPFSMDEWQDGLDKAMKLPVNVQDHTDSFTGKNVHDLKDSILQIVNKNLEKQYEVIEVGAKKTMEINTNKKRILFLGRFCHPPLGGGEYFILYVLQFLHKLGYDCAAVCYYNGETNRMFTTRDYYEWDGIPVHRIPMKTLEDIGEVYREFQPDLVITQSYDAISIVKVAKQMGIKTILGTHFWRNICAVEKTFSEMLSRPMDSVKLLTQFHPVFDMADEVYVNSEFMQKGVERYVGKHIDRIIHPIINPDRIEIEIHDPQYITMVNPDYYKGGSLFVEIAKRMPFTDFLCVGNAPDGDPNNHGINVDLSKLHNVKVVEKTNQMSSIYSNTNVLLVPSIVDETFSMVALEAMWNGIPVIASSAGNLPFLLAGSGIVIDSFDPDEWTTVLKNLIGDRQIYNRISNDEKKRAQDFQPDQELGKFYEMVYGLIGGTT